MSNSINNISFVCGTTHVPTREMWNKKFYVYDKGKLVQGKFTEVRFYKFCDTSWDVSTTAILANGDTLRIYISTKLYASPKDFVEENPILNVWREIFPHDVQSAFCKLFSQIDREGKVYKFCKGNGKYGKGNFQVVSCKLNENLQIIADKDFYERVEKRNGHFYASLAECMKNEGIEVVEFDEEKDTYARIEDYIYRRFLTFMDTKDACEISEKIYYRVVQDISETAAENYNNDDIDIAITRVLKETLGVD
jgi:hypothetical protein